MFASIAIDTIEKIDIDIKKQNNKVKSKTKELSALDRINAEFKHLNKRIKKLEQIVLKQTKDNGFIIEPVIDLKKG